MNYGFTPDGEQADTTTDDIPVTAADVTQTANNQVTYYINQVVMALFLSRSKPLTQNQLLEKGHHN